MAEQDARGALELAESQGRAEGLAEGLRHTVEDLCELLGIELSQTHSDFLASATVDDLEALRARLKRDRRWDPAIE
ncbi:MAG: hypothetical protein GY856_14535 [bacterium]|nr:hypothetical protein [bacterium]